MKYFFGIFFALASFSAFSKTLDVTVQYFRDGSLISKVRIISNLGLKSEMKRDKDSEEFKIQLTGKEISENAVSLKGAATFS